MINWTFNIARLRGYSDIEHHSEQSYSLIYFENHYSHSDYLLASGEGTPNLEKKSLAHPSRHTYLTRNHSKDPTSHQFPPVIPTLRAIRWQNIRAPSLQSSHLVNRASIAIPPNAPTGNKSYSRTHCQLRFSIESNHYCDIRPIPVLI